MSGRSENLSGLRLPVGSHMTAVFIIAIISVSHNQDLLSKHTQNTFKTASIQIQDHIKRPYNMQHICGPDAVTSAARTQ